MSKEDSIEYSLSNIGKASDRLEMAKTYLYESESAVQHDVGVAIDKLESALETLNEAFEDED